MSTGSSVFQVSIASLTRLVPDGEELKPTSHLVLPPSYEAHVNGRSGRPWISSYLYAPQYRIRVSGTRVWFEELSLPGQTVYSFSGPWLVASAPHVESAHIYGP